jgi:hypothetical protein
MEGGGGENQEYGSVGTECADKESEPMKNVKLEW